MQSNLYLSTHSCFSWNPHKPKIVKHNFEQLSLLNNQTLNSKPKIDKLKTLINSPQSVSNFLKITSLNFGEEETFYLPVSVRNSNSHFRYIWDGKNLNLVSVDGNALSISDFDSNFERTFQKLLTICISAIRNFFLPREVSRNYLEYVKWKFVHRVSSSALQVLATQAMLRAIGIGNSRSLPLAAALNWVLKDGLGRLCRCIYTASLASSFDTNLKTAVHRSFAIADNLGEVSAKGQIQTVCFDNLGLTLAATLNILSANNPRLQAGLPFVMYPIFAVLDLFGIYQGLKHVHLQTLTKDRLDIIISTWIQQGFVPSPEEVSKQEGIGLFWSRGREPWSVRIGCLNPRRCTAKLSVMTMKSLNSEDFYFLSPESLTSGLKRNQEYGVLLSLREGAGTKDVIRGILHASYVRKGIEACGSSSAVLKQWFNLVEDGNRSTEQNLSLFYEQMLSLGWACKNILLSTQEQARYSFIVD